MTWCMSVICLTRLNNPSLRFRENRVRISTLTKIFAWPLRTCFKLSEKPPAAFRRSFAQITRPCHGAAIIGMRHKVVHDYLSVDYDIVWDTVANELPPMIENQRRILGSQDHEWADPGRNLRRLQLVH